MAQFSQKGWIIRTALRDGREFFEHFDESTPRSERRSELEMRALIEKRMNHFKFSQPDPEDHARDGEVVWTFSEKGYLGNAIGSRLRFLAPTMWDIRSTRVRDLENARRARQAMRERAEIKRAMKSGKRTAKTRDASQSRIAVINVLPDHPHDEPCDMPIAMPAPTPSAPRRSGGMRL